MEYTPKYPQPFTLEKAVALDPEVASDEIARLQNSIAHLKRTQDELKDYMEDPELRASRASQDERIFMLKLALTHHGISHTSPSLPASISSTLHENDAIARNSDPHSIPREPASEDDGVYL
ncbi:hypothetical protein ID866_5366 [Astraeus odoratus]|nr:hypothetical protein ID866_5366 [Astraeus odoratus]